MVFVGRLTVQAAQASILVDSSVGSQKLSSRLVLSAELDHLRQYKNDANDLNTMKRRTFQRPRNPKEFK
eukprot:767177-Amphidinium_carterae.1